MRNYILGILIVISINSIAQEKRNFKIHTIAFYNVENLFDTINDVNKNDEASPIMEIKFNRSENDISFIKNSTNETNPFSETTKKNISTDLLKQIIVSRLDEIIEMSIFDSKSITNLNPLWKHKLIITGGGSKLLSNNYNLNINKIFSELVSYDENDSLVCEAGLNYHKSNESFHIKTKEKSKKLGFFENFFNIFSK